MDKILMIDNYDSFTYNLVHCIEALGVGVDVARNDKLELKDVKPYKGIVLSPGPGIPDEAGLLKPIIETYGPQKRILGICLGQQAIAEVYGGTLVNLAKVYHGTATSVHIKERDYLFNGLPDVITVGRYHSWVVDPSLPNMLEATSFDDHGNVMSLRHREHHVRGLQFHPESILTPDGQTIMQNWLNGKPHVP